jgi:methionyl-tRNA formyltransferase
VLATEPLLERFRGDLTPEAADLLTDVQAWPEGEPGELVALPEAGGVVVATGEGPLLVREAQLEGKGPCRGTALVQQLKAQLGDHLGGDPGEGNR